MREDEKKDLIEKWQILGLTFMMMSNSQEGFFNLVKQEFVFVRGFTG